MAWDTLKLIRLSIGFVIPYLFQALNDRIAAVIHKFTYETTADAKNVVIVGGSWAGVEVARRLMHSLPTGYKVVLIEQNSHFNYTFNFPRYSVITGRERLAFIPYDGLAESAPAGIFQRVQQRAVSITADSVLLGDESSVAYAYLVLATGSARNALVCMSSTDRDAACAELQRMQDRIRAAKSIAVVGGGAVGVELAADIKSYLPEKEVTLIHSRDQLLPRFGRRLHDHVLTVLQDLGVIVRLGQRPAVQHPDPSHSQIESKKEARAELTSEFDLIIPCTGQVAATSILHGYLDDAISANNDSVAVSGTLQIICSQKASRGNIFALGDVADSGGPKMARAGFFQAKIVQRNILSLIRGLPARAMYQPNPAIEGALKLTLGKKESVTYTQLDDGDEILLTSKKGSEDLEVKMAWRIYRADFTKAVQELRA